MFSTVFRHLDYRLKVLRSVRLNVFICLFSFSKDALKMTKSYGREHQKIFFAVFLFFGLKNVFVLPLK